MRLNCIDSGSLPAGSPLQVARERASGGGKGELSSLSLDYEQSLFFSWSFEQNARDTQMTTRVTEVPHLAHLRLPSRAALEWLLSTPPSGEFAHRLCKKERKKKKVVGSNDHPMSLAKKKEKKQHIKISFLVETDDLTWPNMT